MENLIDEIKDNEEILRHRGFHVMVVVNERLLSHRAYKGHIIKDGDNVKVLSVSGGG